MPEQPLRFCFTIPPKPTDNLFLALFPTAEAARHITQLADHLRMKHGLRGKPLATDRFHVTLFAFRIYPGLSENEFLVRSVSAASASVAAPVPPFEVRFDRAGSFAGRADHRPLVLRDSGNNAALMGFHDHLGRALGGGKARFTPHVTLLYDRLSVAEEPVELVRWKVNEFVLVHSLVGQTRYLPLARWAFRG